MRDGLSAELLESAEEVRGTPPLGDPAAGEPHDVEGGDLDLPVGWRNSQEPASLGASPDDMPATRFPSASTVSTLPPKSGNDDRTADAHCLKPTIPGT
jgi:hypothetical protein